MASIGFIFIQALGVLAAWWLGFGGWQLVIGALAGAWLWWLLTAWQNARFYQWAKNEGQASSRFWGYWANLQYFWRKLQRKHLYREERQERNLQELRMAIQASPNGVMLLDHEWSIVWLNHMSCEHFGLNVDQDMGQNLLTLVRDPEFASYCAVGDFRETLEMDGRGFSAMGGGDRRRLSIQVFPYGDDKQLMLSRDISHMQRTEAMRRDFIANVSHEIRTPLTIFSGYVETLQTLPLDQTDRERYYQRMQQQARRMQVLVEDLLTLSRLEGSPLPSLKEYIEIKPLLLRCLEEAAVLSSSLAPDALEPVHTLSLLYTESNGESRELHAGHAAAAPVSTRGNGSSDQEMEPGQAAVQPPVAGWPSTMGRLAGIDKEIYSAFSNLVANAVRYTPAHGRICLIWTWHVDGSATFGVKDTGPGIAVEHLPRVTERFYRVDRSRSRETGGTGLGLAIVKHVAQRHGGHLRIDSVVGEGSCFHIDLPLTRLQTPAAVQAAEQERARRERMLAA
ncbi:ATP-binding protein [Lampropedia aestuarii]|uniref:ATP-binding protein n=1 Tax=Lampropedia aestuarii TaxID=2562762 RepID=UPI0024689818|nr:ATP-binding protein [Lampropedia aestuarii]MDH5857217.1 ATP-binding protein [Lampropedia aestuarii]